MKLPVAKIVIIIVFIGGIFVLINLSGLPKPVKNFFYGFSSPLQSFFWSVGKNISDLGSGLFKAQDLKKENESLQIINKELLAELLILREIKTENEFLKSSMDIGIDKEFDLILTQIISKDISRDSILINKGLHDGVRKNQPVLTGQKTLLGRIGEVYENFAEVILISNPEISFDAKISETEAIGVVKGKGRSAIKLEFVPKDKELKEGAFVVSAALGGIFPEGILIGQLRAVENADTDPFWSAEINQSFDLKLLDKVFIIKNFDSLP